jgi:hypothetical protein
MGAAVVLFVISLAGVGGAYAWKAILTSSQASYKQELADREKQFNVDLIEQLKAANIKIDLVKGLLANHLAISEVFDVISRLTIQSVRFLSLNVSAQDAQKSSNGISVSMHGYGTSFSAVAFQSDVLSQLEQYGLRKVVINPILSDPALDSNGTVSFGFSAAIDPGSLSYEKSVTSSAATSAAAASSSAATGSGQ